MEAFVDKQREMRTLSMYGAPHVDGFVYMFNRNARIVLVFSLCLVMALVALSENAQAQVTSSPPQNALARIAWLVGKWTTVDLAAGGGTFTLQLEGKWAPDMNSILVSCTRIPEKQKPTLFYQSTYSWDPQKNKIVVKQIYANGDRFEGEVTPIEGDFAQVGRIYKADGSRQDFQNRFVAWSPDTFSIEVTMPGQPLDLLGTGLDQVYLRAKSTAVASNAGAAQQ